MNSSDIKKPSHKKSKTNKSPSLFSLPDEIIVSCLARISKSYYPKLTLVCKAFRDIILSKNLYLARLHLGTRENILHVCLQLPSKICPSWFSLWIKPNQTLTNNIINNKKKKNTTLLVPIPSSYSPRTRRFIFTIGSVSYAIKKYNTNPSSVMRVRNNSTTYKWSKGPSMTVARSNAVACVLNDKLYVIGGYAARDSAYWAEVFDPKTQTWETLHGPIRGELHVKKMTVVEGKIYVKSVQGIKYVYDPKESSKWEVSKKKGMINEKISYDIVETGNYGGKILILWEKFVPYHRQEKHIWCAVVALERRKNNSEVYGKVEWASSVLKVPNSYVFCRCEVKRV
ncbi:unnamed protein product [Cochlearia groenlandica]